ncbi:hypothetical protein RDI58_022832 [Solanum bulbocastanum]|uniref:Uncharacterized protein n=1 Tax=Solanum bulbocastanum TaxID=147425 RepID=A0AAN8T2U1_SOLBU
MTLVGETLSIVSFLHNQKKPSRKKLRFFLLFCRQVKH